MATTRFAFPFPQAWDAQDLADAVPLRLHALPPFVAGTGGADACANSMRTVRRRPRAGYHRVPELARFRIA